MDNNIENKQLDINKKSDIDNSNSNFNIGLNEINKTKEAVNNIIGGYVLFLSIESSWDDTISIGDGIELDNFTNGIIDVIKQSNGNFSLFLETIKNTELQNDLQLDELHTYGDTYLDDEDFKEIWDKVIPILNK